MHTGYERDRGRMEQDRMRSDMDRTRPDDQSRDHGNPTPSDQDRSGSENGYQHAGYEQQTGTHGHAKPPPVTSHNPSKQKPPGSPDDENDGPGE